MVYQYGRYACLTHSTRSPRVGPSRFRETCCLSTRLSSSPAPRKKGQIWGKAASVFVAILAQEHSVRLTAPFQGRTPGERAFGLEQPWAARRLIYLALD